MAEREGTKGGARAALNQKVTEQAQASNRDRAARARQELDDVEAKPGDATGLAAMAGAILRGESPGQKAKRGQADPDPEDDEIPPDQAEGDDDQAGKRGPDDGDPDDDDQGDPDEEGDEDDAGQDKPATLDEAAKRLGMTRQEFNAIPVQVGAQSMTLGELKAKLPELLKLDQSREQLEDDRGTWELERIASYRNINAIIDALPKNAHTAGMLRELERQHENERNRELESLHFARPRWADPTYATGARDKIAKMAADYGITRAEINALMDHRHVLLAQDFAELREKVKASREAARKVNEPDGSRAKGQGPARGDAGTTNGSSRTRVKPTQEGLAQRAGAILRNRR
ncbi:MAG TPA: hypothetical protein VLC08_06155 [Chitinolyticbacter sp.]|nr:hypothetical protein [Chitinolyticbacter sp.]